MVGVALLVEHIPIPSPQFHLSISIESMPALRHHIECTQAKEMLVCGSDINGRTASLLRIWIFFRESFGASFHESPALSPSDMESAFVVERPPLPFRFPLLQTPSIKKSQHYLFCASYAPRARSPT